MERDKLKEKYEIYKEAYEKHQEKLKSMAKNKQEKERAVEWIQASFRGFLLRKQQRKKFKPLKNYRRHRHPFVPKLDDQ